MSNGPRVLSPVVPTRGRAGGGYDFESFFNRAKATAHMPNTASSLNPVGDDPAKVVESIDVKWWSEKLGRADSLSSWSTAAHNALKKWKGDVKNRQKYVLSVSQDKEQHAIHLWLGIAE